MSASANISLLEALQRVPDPRKRRGVRYSIQALLTLAATAIVAGMRSVSAIGEFAHNHPEVAVELGFRRKKLPCQGTFHYLFKALDIDKFEDALRAWSLAFCPPDGAPKVIHIDGKSLRGSRREAADCVHLLSAYCNEASAVVAQLKVDGKTNEPKTALELLRLIPMKGAIITGDAIFTQRDLSQDILKSGGDYMWTVKDNQKTLRSEINSAFDAEPLPPRATATQGGPAHGRDDGQGPRARGRAAHRNAVAISVAD